MKEIVKPEEEYREKSSDSGFSFIHRHVCTHAHTHTQYVYGAVFFLDVFILKPNHNVL